MGRTVKAHAQRLDPWQAVTAKGSTELRRRVPARCGHVHRAARQECRDIAGLSAEKRKHISEERFWLPAQLFEESVEDPLGAKHLFESFDILEVARSLPH